MYSKYKKKMSQRSTIFYCISSCLLFLGNIKCFLTKTVFSSSFITTAIIFIVTDGKLVSFKNLPVSCSLYCCLYSWSVDSEVLLSSVNTWLWPNCSRYINNFSEEEEGLLLITDPSWHLGSAPRAINTEESCSSETGGVVEPFMESMSVVFTEHWPIGDCNRISVCSEPWYAGIRISSLSHKDENVSDAVKDVSESSASPTAAEIWLSICTSRVAAKKSWLADGFCGYCRERHIFWI